MNRRLILLVFILLLATAAGGAYFVSPTVRYMIDDIGQSGRELVTVPLRNGDIIKSSTPLSRQGVIEKTNEQRALQGFAPYAENEKLNAAAEAKLNDMFDRQYFEHISPEGNGPSYLARQAGYSYLVVGENLALGNFDGDAALVQAWMDSPGHRANILHDKFTEIGVAVGEGMYEGKMVWLAVQEFGKPASSCPTINPNLKAKVDEQTAEVEELNKEIAEKKQELANMPQSTDEQRQAYNAKVAEYNRLVKTYNNALDTLKSNIDRYNQEVKAFNACLKN